LLVRPFFDLKKCGAIGARDERVPGSARGLVAYVFAVLSHDVAFEHGSGIVESHDIKRATQDERELGFRHMAVGSKVGLPVCDDEEALHRIVG
jgi:hypothetical protein